MRPGCTVRSCRSLRSEAPPQDQTGTAARAGSSQDARTVSRAPGAQLPASDLPGDLPQPVPGMDAAQDCSRAGSRAPEAAATPPGSSPGHPEGPRRAAAVLPSSRPAPGRSTPRSRSSSPPRPGQGRRRCRVPSITGTRPGSPATLPPIHAGARCRYSHLYYGNQSTPPEAREGPQEQGKPRTCFYIPSPAKTRQA